MSDGTRTPTNDVSDLRAKLAARDAELDELRRKYEALSATAAPVAAAAAAAAAAAPPTKPSPRRGETSSAALDAGAGAAGEGSAGSSSGGNAAGAGDERAALQELAALRQQVDSMRAMLPILTIPNFTFSLVPSSSEGGGKEVAIYEIVVNYGENVYAVYRRYSEFRGLHEHLEAEFKDKELLPRFPARQGLFRSTNNSSKAIERRKRELQTYIRQLVASDDIRASVHIRNFFAQLALDPKGGDGYEASIPHTASEDGADD